MYIIRNGVLYEDAVDPEGTEDRVYGETNAMIPIEESPEESEEAEDAP